MNERTDHELFQLLLGRDEEMQRNWNRVWSLCCACGIRLADMANCGSGVTGLTTGVMGV